MYTEKKMHAVQRTGPLYGVHLFLGLNGLWTDLTMEQVLMVSMKSRGGLTHGRGLTDSVRNQWVHIRCTIFQQYIWPWGYSLEGSV